MNNAKNLMKDFGVSMIPYSLVAIGVVSALKNGDFTGGANHAIHLGTMIGPAISAAATHYYPRDNSKNFVRTGSRLLACFKLAAATFAGASSIAAGVYTYAQTQVPANLTMTGAAVSTAIVAGFCLHRQARKARQARNNPQFFEANDSHETFEPAVAGPQKESFFSWATNEIGKQGKEIAAQIRGQNWLGDTTLGELAQQIRESRQTRPVIARPTEQAQPTEQRYKFVSTRRPSSPQAP